jgi:tetratricopeptide (TPR) repeat protein
VRDQPDVPEHQRSSMIAEMNLGSVASEEGRATESLEHYRTAADRGNGLKGTPSYSGEVCYSHGEALRRLGSALLKVGETRQAADVYAQAVEAAERLADEKKDNLAYQHNLCNSLESLGEARRLLKDHAGARKHLERALKIRLGLQDGEDDVGLATTYRLLADADLAVGDYGQALKHITKSQEIEEKAYDEDRHNIAAIRGLSLVYNKLAEVHIRAEDNEKAETFSRKAVDTCQRWSEADPSDVEASRMLSAALDRWATMLSRQSKNEDARKAWERAADLSRLQLKVDARNIYARRDLSISLSKLGTLCREMGDLDASLAFHEECLELRRELQEADPGNPLYTREVGVTYRALGTTYRARHDMAKAREFYDRCRDVREKYYQRYPQDLQTRKDLLTIYSELGNLAQNALYRYSEAIEWYGKARDFARREPTVDPKGSMQAQAERIILDCERRMLLMKDLGALPELAGVQRANLLSGVIRAHAIAGDADKCTAAIDKLLKTAGGESVPHFHAACGYALCSAMTKAPEQKEEFAKRAVEQLREAMSKGFKEDESIRSAFELDTLRDRADFREWAKGLPKTKPATKGE